MLLILAISIVFSVALFANSAVLFEHSNQNAWTINAYLSLKGETLPMAFWPLPDGLLNKYVPISDDSSPEVSTAFITVSPEISANNWSYKPSSVWVDLVQAYRYDSMKSFMTFGYKSYVGNDLYFLIYMDLRKELGNFFYNDDNTNFPITRLDVLKPALDFNFPTKGYASYYNGSFSFNMGREQLAWGPMEHGLALSDNSPYYDEMSFGYTTPAKFCKQFSFNFSAISVDPSLTHQEFDEQSQSPDSNAGGFVYNERAKFLFAHRLDFLVAKNFRVGMGELKVLGGKFPDFQDFNPFIIWHNTYGEGYSNVLGSADFNYVPVDGLSLYGEFAVDDVTMPTEAPNYKPTAYAYALGINKNWGDWNDLSQVGATYYYALPWMYNRWQPYLEFTNRIMRISNDPGSRLFTDYPFGYIYGPDVETLNLFYKHHQNNIDFEAGFNWIKKGSITTLTYYNTNEYNLVTPTGTVEDTKDLYAQISVPVSKNLNLFGSADLRYVENFRNQDLPSDNKVLGNMWLYDLRVGASYSF